MSSSNNSTPSADGGAPAAAIPRAPRAAEAAESAEHTAEHTAARATGVASDSRQSGSSTTISAAGEVLFFVSRCARCC